MGCGCMGNKEKVFIYVDAQGRETEHKTQVQARAAQIRAGGKGHITERAKI